MEAVHYGRWTAVNWFSYFINVAIKRSAATATWNVSARETIVNAGRH